MGSIPDREHEAMLPEGRPQAVMGLAGPPAPHEGLLMSSAGLGLPVNLVNAFPEPELSCPVRLLPRPLQSFLHLLSPFTGETLA